MGIEEEKRKQSSEQMKKAQLKLKGRHSDEEVNPCLEEQEFSFKCLNDNNYDHDKCQKYFDNYKICKNFWLSVEKDRRQKNIQPLLPPAEERKNIKAAYLKSFHGQ